MRHRYACPLRWADLDLLGHVNNVTYVDYLQEARVDLLRALTPQESPTDPDEGVLVVSTDITYLAPLKFRYGSVFVDTWVCEVRAASFALAYEIYDEREGERILYARARTVLTPYVFSRKAPRRLTAPERTRLIEAMEPDEPVRPTPIRAVVSELGHFALHTRFSDLDIYGHVNKVKYVEYFQEGRGALLTRASQAVGRRASGGHVVAQVRIEYVRPLLYREQPYDLFTSVSHLGTKSMTMEAEIRDGDVVCARARAAVVFYDPEAGASAPIPDDLRKHLTQ